MAQFPSDDSEDRPRPGAGDNPAGTGQGGQEQPPTPSWDRPGSSRAPGSTPDWPTPEWPPPGGYQPQTGYPPQTGYQPQGGYGAPSVPPYGPPPYAPPPTYAPPGETFGSSEGTGQVELAGWGRRAGGYLIDSLLVFVVLWALISIFHDHGRLLAAAVAELVQLVYVVAMIATRGQTLGMMAVRVRLHDTNTGSSVIGFPKALLRAITYGVIAIAGSLFIVLLVLPVLNLLWPLWDPKNQTWHDKVAGTVAVLER